MSASSASVAVVAVSLPVGTVATTLAKPPVDGLTKFSAVATAFSRPGDVPEIRAPPANWPSAYADPTVVSSLTITARRGRYTDPATLNSCTADPGARRLPVAVT